ncbi:ribosomal large subunit pseudouridine synthase E [Ekhidna lutea]|uniref:Pseudouridine synthase n=1 Tax=Ekhidna lutea TaxID=447679 RepID=A0A239H2Z8_EKHLU|nr:pseudouridine synthase [Ekhidna lutea]SNS75552.1 ribosomal large subunit pseudouridine synthase E [Ekhidna lutea]
MAKKNLYFIIHKPFKVLSQFSNEGENIGLGAIYNDLPKDVYPVGRLDLDSEGLLILTNDKSLNNRLLNPKHNHQRTYWVEVDGGPDKEALQQLEKGVEINVSGKKHRTKPAKVSIVTPDIPERNPPVNYKKHPIRTWLQLSLTEGKNRQVRRMTAKVGHPTLRLLRVGIEDLSLEPLKSGEITQVSEKVIYKKLNLL